MNNGATLAREDVAVERGWISAVVEYRPHVVESVLGVVIGLDVGNVGMAEDIVLDHVLIAAAELKAYFHFGCPFGLTAYSDDEAPLTFEESPALGRERAGGMTSNLEVAAVGATHLREDLGGGDEHKCEGGGGEENVHGGFVPFDWN